MNNLDKETKRGYIEKVLYIMSALGGNVDKYHLFKIMYFAQRDYLRKYGMVIFPDNFIALQYGPVPSLLYNALSGYYPSEISDDIKGVISTGEADAQNYIFANKEPNMAYLSKAAKETLDDSIQKHSTQTFNELKELSHTELWKKAYMTSGHLMTPFEIAKDADAPESVLDYIKDNEDFERAFV